jgi:hypothetical protein
MFILLCDRRWLVGICAVVGGELGHMRQRLDIGRDPQLRKALPSRYWPKVSYQWCSRLCFELNLSLRHED